MYFITFVLIKTMCKTKFRDTHHLLIPAPGSWARQSVQRKPRAVNICVTMYVRHVVISEIKLFKSDTTEGQSSQS